MAAREVFWLEYEGSFSGLRVAPLAALTGEKGSVFVYLVVARTDIGVCFGPFSRTLTAWETEDINCANWTDRGFQSLAQGGDWIFGTYRAGEAVLSRVDEDDHGESSDTVAIAHSLDRMEAFDGASFMLIGDGPRPGTEGTGLAVTTVNRRDFDVEWGPVWSGYELGDSGAGASWSTQTDDDVVLFTSHEDDAGDLVPLFLTFNKPLREWVATAVDEQRVDELSPSENELLEDAIAIFPWGDFAGYVYRGPSESMRFRTLTCEDGD